MSRSRFPKRRAIGTSADMAARSSRNMIAEIWDLVCDAPLTELSALENALEGAKKRSRADHVVITAATVERSITTDKGKKGAVRGFFGLRKSCPFAGRDAPRIDYKDVRLLQGFVSERGKIVPSRITAVSTKKQRELAKSVKRARGLGFLRGRPDTSET